jgi:hypothetical protein
MALWGALPRDKDVMPWRTEDELKALGANYIQAGLWKGFATCFRAGRESGPLLDRPGLEA